MFFCDRLARWLKLSNHQSLLNVAREERNKDTFTEMLARCLGLIMSVHVCELLTKISFQLSIKMWDSVYTCSILFFKNIPPQMSLMDLFKFNDEQQTSLIKLYSNYRLHLSNLSSSLVKMCAKICRTHFFLRIKLPILLFFSRNIVIKSCVRWIKRN